MGRTRKYVHGRLKNLQGGIQTLIEHFSPRKKQKVASDDAIHASQNGNFPSVCDSFGAENPFLESISAGNTSFRQSRPHAHSSKLDATFELPPIKKSPKPYAEDDTESMDVSDTSSYATVDTFGFPVDPDPILFSTSETSITFDPISTSSITRVPKPTLLPSTAKSPDMDLIREGKAREAPTILQSQAALSDLVIFLRGPSKGKGGGYKTPDFDKFVIIRLHGMQALLNFYTDPRSKTHGQWGASSLQAAVASGHGTYCARQLRKLCRAYILDRQVLPINPYGSWNKSLLLDEDLMNEINMYLQQLGDKITASKLAEFLSQTDIMDKYGITKKISIWTARRYLHALGYRFSHPSKGQYADGHEREDVIYYRQNTFLPRLLELEQFIRPYIDGLPVYGPFTPDKQVILWFHDESIFYANDRRRKSWYHKDSPAKPYKKGEGASLMVADYVSAEFGWLKSRDKTRNARRVMKPGKNRDGYFDNDDIQEQAEAAMDIVSSDYPEYEHVFVYDNAPSHLKRADGALSARKMTKKPSDKFLVEVTKRDANGKPEYNSDGTRKKIKIRMNDAEFNGHPQCLYFPEGHPQAGMFKGVAQILQERGLFAEARLNLECKSFKCPPAASNCCARRVLYKQPDFVNQPTLLQSVFSARGFEVIFLPKFHCELNFIEQCWGYAKRLYRLNPESSREDQLEKFTLDALEGVPLLSMRKFAFRSRKFMHAYAQGLNGKQAAWAARKYRGHRVIPEDILRELEKAGVS